jgi:hypothetical protein
MLEDQRSGTALGRRRRPLSDLTVPGAEGGGAHLSLTSRADDQNFLAPALGPRHHFGPRELRITEVTAHRAMTVVSLLGLFGVAFATWATVVQVPITGAISVIGFAAGLALVVAALVVTPRRLPRVDAVALVLGLLLLAGWALSNIYAQPGYGTDEAAFEQYGASLLLHGHDPYGANLTAALTQYRVPVQYATYLLGGGVVHSFGYPALPLLVGALSVVLTGGVQSVIIANVVALGATTLCTYLLMPRAWRPMAVLVTIGLPVLFGYSVSGVNAVLMGLPLVVVAWRWTETGRGGSLGGRGRGRAVCLGLALATQPLAWFIVPFVLVGVWELRRGELGRRGATRVVATFALLGTAMFLAINLPFIVWGPGAWISGVTSTLTQHAIPYGQGLVDASLFFHLGGGNLALYTVAGVLFYLGALSCYATYFARLGRACFVLPVTALFFTTRSLAEYFMVMVAVWAVSLVTTEAEAFTTGGGPGTRYPRRRRRGWGPLTVAAMFGPAMLTAMAALAAPSPLRLTVVSVTTNGELAGVWRVKVAVTDTSHRTLSPEFQANFLGQATTFFHRVSGPATLAPRQRAVYTLTAPNRGSMPGIVEPFVMLATTGRPETLSVSPQFIPQPYGADLEPGYVNRVVPRHSAVTFHIYLRSPFGARVRKSGVNVALGQVIYGQQALVDAEASINQAPEGATPVYAPTNAQGEATFVVSDPQPQGQPLYFQAWVAGAYPFGYSDIVPVTWKD